MSIYSEYKVGALTYEEFVRQCVVENAREKYYDYYYDYDYDMEENDDEE